MEFHFNLTWLNESFELEERINLKNHEMTQGKVEKYLTFHGI